MWKLGLAAIGTVVGLWLVWSFMKTLFVWTLLACVGLGVGYGVYTFFKK